MNYFPFVIVKSNVDTKKLYYSLQVFNTSTNKVVLDSAKKIQAGIKYPLRNNYKTEIMNIPTDGESAKDMVIEFTLYKRDGIKFIPVVNKKILSNMVFEFTLDNIKSNKIKYDIVNYMETKNITKPVTGVNNNLVQLTISNTRMFVSTQHPVGDYFDPFTKEKIQQGLLSRLKEKYPDQGFTNLCGPAAFFYCVLNANSNIYKKIVKELWEKGETKVNNLKIKPDKGGARTVKNYFDEHDNALIPAIDWITLGSLRDSSNIILDYTLEYGEASAGITPPGDLLTWFRDIGFKNVDFFHIGISNKLKALVETSKYDVKKYFIVLLSSSSILQYQKKTLAVFPTHWVVLDSNIMVDGSLLNSTTLETDEVKFKVFSWGKSYNQNDGLTLGELVKYTWGVYIFERGLV